MEELKQLVRVANSDLVGTKPIHYALRKIKGVDYAFASAICNIAGFDKNKKVGSLTPEEVKKIEHIINNPKQYNIPGWLLNRRKDPTTGEDSHVIASDLQFRKESDIKNLKTIRTYRGMRHAFGLPVRGQRTKGHFRKGAAIGVRRKGLKLAAARAGAEKKPERSSGKASKKPEKK